MSDRQFATTSFDWCACKTRTATIWSEMATLCARMQRILEQMKRSERESAKFTYQWNA
jgi:hypothetical protein